MVSAPATYWMSAQSRPASSSASVAALIPYSTKLRPHLPHGCIPAPRTAIRLSSAIGRVRTGATGPVERPPLPDQVLMVVVLVEGLDGDLDLRTDAQVGDV